jgi:myo-inositol-1-phosphate synthase
MADIRVAVIGVGNVGATFVQGIDYYSGKYTVGLWHQKVAGLKPSNVKIVAAFDIDPAKVGKNLSQVATQSTKKYYDVKDSKVPVKPGILSDSNGKISNPVKVSPDEFA